MVNDFETKISDEEASKFKAPDTTEGSPEPVSKIEEKKPIPEMVVSQEKYDEQQRLIHEHKAGYKDLTAKEKGEANWVNDNRYSYYDKNRRIEETKTGYKNEEAYKNGKMDWGHTTRSTYNDKENSVLAESKDLKKEGVTWQEKTQYGPDGWRKLERSGETTGGPEKGKSWSMSYDYTEGKKEHAGQTFQGIIETEDGREEAPDGSEKTWRKIVVYNEKKEHIAHWREKESPKE